MKFRPAADVARDLLRLSTSAKQREARSKKDDSTIRRVLDLSGAVVIQADALDDLTRIVLTLREPDRRRVEVATSEAARMAGHKHCGGFVRPIQKQNGAPVLALNVEDVPADLTVGATVDLRIGLRVDGAAEYPIVQAAVMRFAQIISPVAQARAITLPAVSMTAVSDTDLGMPEDSVAQHRAERFLEAAYAYKRREAEKARDAARQRMIPGPTIHVEVEDDALTLVNPTDALDADDLAILAELRRLTERTRCRWLRSKTEAAPLVS